MEHILRLDKVTKRYDRHTAVDQVSLDIPRGAIFGLLGPNGAGKTSSIRMITGITAPDEGKIWFDGDYLSETSSMRMGYMPEERGLYKKMKVKEQVAYLLALRGMAPAAARKTTAEWLDRLGLGAWGDRNAADLSKGMQQKVQFIATVAHEPSLLILDEPFSGLDPVNARMIEQEIFRLRDAGTTIIFSTHRLEQVEEVCDHIALINKGKVQIAGGTSAVRSKFQRNLFRVEFQGNKEWFTEHPQLSVERLTANVANVLLPEGESGKALLQMLADSPLEILKFELQMPRLTDIFITLVGASVESIEEKEKTATPNA